MTDFLIGVADDEAGIRESVSLALEEEYSARFPGRTLGTVHFERASDVVDYFLDEPDQLDLLLLDVRFELTGGGETGVDVLPDIRELRPDIPIWLVTGTVRDDEISLASRFHPIDYIEKPASRDTLVRKVFLRLNSGAVNERRAFVDAMAAIADRSKSARESAASLEQTGHLGGVETLLRGMFPRVSIHKSALKELMSTPAIEDVMRTIYRLSNEELTAGNRRIAFSAAPGVEEIRSSQRTRIFVERRERGWNLLAITNQHEHVSSAFVDVLKARRNGT